MLPIVVSDEFLIKIVVLTTLSIRLDVPSFELLVYLIVSLMFVMLCRSILFLRGRLCILRATAR